MDNYDEEDCALPVLTRTDSDTSKLDNITPHHSWYLTQLDWDNINQGLPLHKLPSGTYMYKGRELKIITTKL